MSELIAASQKPKIELKKTPSGDFAVLMYAGKTDNVETVVVLHPEQLVNLYKFLNTVNDLYPLRYLTEQPIS